MFVVQIFFDEDPSLDLKIGFISHFHRKRYNWVLMPQPILMSFILVILPAVVHWQMLREHDNIFLWIIFLQSLPQKGTKTLHI